MKNELLHNLGKPAIMTLVKEYNLISKVNERITFYDYGEEFKMEMMDQFHNRDKIDRVEARRRWKSLIADSWTRSR